MSHFLVNKSLYKTLSASRVCTWVYNPHFRIHLPLKKYKIVCVHLKPCMSTWSCQYDPWFTVSLEHESFTFHNHKLSPPRDDVIDESSAAVFCCHGDSVTFGIAHTSEFVRFLPSFLLKAVKYLSALPHRGIFTIQCGKHWESLGKCLYREVTATKKTHLKLTSWAHGGDGTIKHICRARTACDLMGHV